MLSLNSSSSKSLFLFFFTLLFFFYSLNSYAQCREDRIQSLLASPDRIGFGADATGGAKANSFTIVSSTADSGPGSLRDALSKKTPLWITFSPSIHGKTIKLKDVINVHAKDITIDGRGENGQMAGITIALDGRSEREVPRALVFRGGNVILHGLTFKGLGEGRDSDALSFREGDNYWIDHITISDVYHHNTISLAQPSKDTSADYITISNYKVFNSTYGVLSNGTGKDPQHKGAHVTIFNSNMAALDRNPNIKRGVAHIFNNYIHSFKYTGVKSLNEAKSIVENNYFSAAEANSGDVAMRSGVSIDGEIFKTGHIFESGNIMVDGAGTSGSVNPGSVSRPQINYDYSLIESKNVRSYVLANAGAENASGSLSYCNNGSSPSPDEVSSPAATDGGDDEQSDDVAIEPKIDSVQLEKITTNSATIAIKFDKAVRAHLLWGLPPEYGNHTPVSEGVEANHLITISGLQPNQTYQYRAVGADLEGNTISSIKFEFKTQSNPNPDSYPSQNGGCIDPDGDGYGVRDGRPCRAKPSKTSSESTPLAINDIKVSGVTSSSTQIISVLSKPASGRIEVATNSEFIGSFSFHSGFLRKKNIGNTLTNLAPNTTYYFRVKAWIGRETVTSETQTFKTESVENTTPAPGATVPTTIATTSSSTTTTTLITTSNPGSCRIDRINSLLSSPDRVGFGGKTTGGAAAKKFTVVTSIADRGAGSLREAVQKSDSDPKRNDPVWVIFDESLKGKTIYLNSPISTFQKNLTIDGRGKNGMLDITISRSPSAPSFVLLQLRGGNTIIHGITFDGKGKLATALMPRQGNNVWLDHLTITGFKGDDGISIGQGGKADSTSEITISNYLAYNTSYSIQAGGNDKFPNFPLHRGTILKSSLGASQRSPRITFGGKWHMYNNYVHSFELGSAIDINNGSQMIAEHNVVSGKKSRAPQRAITGRRGAGEMPGGGPIPVGHVYTKGNILLDGADEEGSVNPSSPKAFGIPYLYDIMPVNQVVDYVKQNAGAKNASGDLRVCD